MWLSNLTKVAELDASPALGAGPCPAHHTATKALPYPPLTSPPFGFPAPGYLLHTAQEWPSSGLRPLHLCTSCAQPTGSSLAQQRMSASHVPFIRTKHITLRAHAVLSTSRLVASQRELVTYGPIEHEPIRNTTIDSHAFGLLFL